MSKQKIIINGDNFADLESFYVEIDRVLTKDLDWETGHNLDAFNDFEIISEHKHIEFEIID